ncbi:MAG TPA: GNAT family N-acetyltransferase [Bacillota bacterium]|nr:GNAT family N-acetyltransferase [Bacillota bacterium]
MIALEQIIDFEVNFPRAFASVTDKPDLRLFYNTANPHSQDSNHAVFINLSGNLEETLEELILFYRVRSLIPRVYPSYQPQENRRLLPLLSKRGFEINYSPDTIYVKEYPSRLAPCKSLKVERVRTMADAVRNIICKNDGGDWNAEVLSKQLQSEQFHLLVGYVAHQPVCLGALRRMDNLFRLDEVLTDPDFRGRGYGRALVQGIMEYWRRLSPQSELYLWSSDPTAIRIYREAGFTALQPGLKTWNASYAPVR